MRRPAVPCPEAFCRAEERPVSACPTVRWAASQAGRTTRVANLAERNREDLVQDLSSLVYSMCASLYGPRRAKKKQQLIGNILANDEEQPEAES